MVDNEIEPAPVCLLPWRRLFGHSSWRTPKMAKALFGHVGVSNDVRLVAEVNRLRSRVRDLEIELDRALAVNEVLASQVDVSHELRELDKEPALT